MIRVRVPATSANLGPGFDCMGAALSLYNYIEAAETDGGVKIISRGALQSEREARQNLVYKAMEKVFAEHGKKPLGLSINLYGDIPATRGLGSSAACVVGGAMAANALCGLKMSADDIIRIASGIERHPDNAVPCVLGGFAVAVKDGGRVYHVRREISENLRFALFIPDFKLRTQRAKAALPGRVSHKDAVFNAGRSALLAASIISGDYENIGFAMHDRLHQRYRRPFVPDMYKIFKAAAARGALGVYLSGAGPSIAAVIDKDYEGFAKGMEGFLAGRGHRWETRILPPDNIGAVIET